jgi:hypothetical protein
MDLLTTSRMRAYQACPRLHQYEYELGYRLAVEAEELRFGTLWHEGQAAWWLADSARLEAGIDAIRRNSAYQFDAVKAEELLLGYDAMWSGEALTVLAVEVEFACDLRNPETGAASRTFKLGGKLDGVTLDAAERALIVEHKTTSKDIADGSEYWRRLQLDSQVSTYYEGARALGHEPQGCIYDVVHKPTIRPYQATPVELRKYTKATKDKPSALYANQHEADETPEDFRVRLRQSIVEEPGRYYRRGIVVRLEEDERDAAFDRWQTAAAIREARRAGRWPRNPDACDRWGRTCPYFDVCTRTASLDDPLRFRRAERTHEELSTAIQPVSTKETDDNANSSNSTQASDAA